MDCGQYICTSLHYSSIVSIGESTHGYIAIIINYITFPKLCTFVPAKIHCSCIQKCSFSSNLGHAVATLCVMNWRAPSVRPLCYWQAPGSNLPCIQENKLAFNKWKPCSTVWGQPNRGTYLRICTIFIQHCLDWRRHITAIANGYFTCGSSGYATFRTDIYSTDGNSDAVSYRSVLTNWLQAENTDKTITIYGRRYSVEPGSCGVTVPSLYAPACSAASSAGAPTSDNTAVIVASVFAAMFFILALGLIGYIIAARR